MVIVEDVADGHTPLVTTARKYRVEVNAPIEAPDNIDAVCPEILLKAILSVDDCHWIEPVLPDNVISVGCDPEQIV